MQLSKGYLLPPALPLAPSGRRGSRETEAGLYLAKRMEFIRHPPELSDPTDGEGVQAQVSSRQNVESDGQVAIVLVHGSGVLEVRNESSCCPYSETWTQKTESQPLFYNSDPFASLALTRLRIGRVRSW